MTENFPPLLTVALDKPEKAKPQEDEGIIKCICNFAHDDGATVFCEKCNTWQHIDCYYHPLGEAEKVKQEDFDHSCADCNPRTLDKHQAMERQRIRLGLQPDEDSPLDKRPKKAPAKAPKKKMKPTDLQLNGHAASMDGSKHGSPQDHPPAKKPKMSHRSSQSASSHAPKRSPSHSAQRAIHSHPLSPATTPPDLPNDYELHNYTQQFLDLYDESDVQIVDTNTYANLDMQTLISEWFKDGHDKFREDTACDFKDVVIQSERPPLGHPLKVESKPLKDSVVHRQYLTTPSPIDKDVPLMELNGIVGLQKNYTDQPQSQWSTLCAPLPFVFFPPSVPLFIDTRKEGSSARYVRRSCKPNASIDTYHLLDGSVFHFWLVSDRPIAANEQITLPWEFRFPPETQKRIVKLLGLGDEETNGQMAANIEPDDYRFLSDWISRILSLYGGCACELGNECAFKRFHRNYREKVQPRPNPPKRKRAKTKTHTISPTSTGQATNSRAASEGHLDEMAEADVNVGAGSRSKPPSRDRTPARLGSFDHIGILTEPTNRDKRKVQMAENLFQKSAQEQQQPPRKKKKASTDATATSTTHSGTGKPKVRIGISEVPDKCNGGDEPRYVDSGTSGSKPASPTSAASHHSARSVKPPASSASGSRKGSFEAPRSYSDAAVQTEPEHDHCPKARLKRRVMSLTMRLMAQRRRDVVPQRPSSAMDLDSPTTTKSSLGSPLNAHKQCPLSSPTSAADVDASMPDAPPAPGNVVAFSAPLTNGNVPVVTPKGAKSPELRVSMPPPALTSPTSATSVAAVTTPISTNASASQSLFSTANLPSPLAPPLTNANTATPGPIKKKMSLSEYKNKANKAAASARSTTDTTHPPKTASSSTDPLKATSNSDNGSLDLDQATADPGAGDLSGSIAAAPASTVS
ncbi:PHD-finger domain-containing protein [Diaporthe helianthi]|uniref:PHD-finger domain-containing protein n=1 Tax=Diaporthe helianthi TaxID=158607 RepID=A0A2P5HWR9_DIAHE|nr:PHD-finger domain-containing protein [Diaporthe helianthi]